MGVKFDPTPPKGNLEGAIAKTIEALWQGVTEKRLGAAKSLYQAVTALRNKDESIEQRAWTLWREALTYALRDFFETANLTRKPQDEEEFQRLLHDILTESARSSGSMELSQQDLSNPTELRLYKDLRENLPKLVRYVDPEHGQEPETLRRLMDRCFSQRFRDARVRGAAHFTELERVLGGKVDEDLRRFDEWSSYYGFLRWDVEENPLFGQSKGGPALADIFVPLRFYWRQRPPERPAERHEEDRKITAHVGWLHDEIEAWLNAGEKDDVLRVVTGGPGSGKSSSAKMIARGIADEGRYNVFVTPLHGLDVSAPIDDIVDSYVQAAKTGGKSLTQSPLDRLPNEYKPLLLIFDGLDEVARPDAGGTDVTRKFVSNLRDRLRQAHGIATEARVKALVLGRPRAAEDAADEISLADRALLHVAQLCPLEESAFRRDHDSALEISDPRGLSEIEQRQEFWDNWAAVAPDCPAEAPEALFEAALRDLTVEPLLLYLLIFSGFVSENWKDAAENRNRVYEEIFRRVHRRDADDKGHKLKAGLKNEEDFLTLMECLGLAAWRGGGRTGTTAHFETLRDKIYAPEKADLFKGIETADLDNVALQFYTHLSHRDQPGYAFIHKSFGEYLTARALIEAGEKWLEEYRSRLDNFAADWLKLAGQQAITMEVLCFMAEEARLRVKPRADSPLDWEAARDRVGRLLRISGWTLREGFPAHGDIGSTGSDASWRHREQAQRNAEEALYALILVWGEAGYPTELFGGEVEQGGWSPGPIEVEWPARTAADDLFRRLKFNLSLRTFLDASISHWVFPRMNLATAMLGGANLFGADLSWANLNGADLNGANLIGATLSGANLIGADLSSANLDGADLSRANLSEANLIRANLSRANLSRAKLIEATLGEANLIGANLSRANLIEANLIEANLIEANLSGANLSRAILSRANLSEANLSGAYLSGAYLRSTLCRRARFRSSRLHDVDFTDATDLTQEQIDAAEGNARTKLPEGLIHPEHWRVDDRESPAAPE